MTAPGRMVSIPVEDIYKYWAWIAKEPIPADKEVTAEVIWTDTPALVDPANGVKISLGGKNKKEYALINVSVPKMLPEGAGNVVIGMKMAGETTYRWSWTIWVTDYDPEDPAGQKTWNGLTWMDRNLGAHGNTDAASDYAFGLLYQWGRKDPSVSGNETYTPFKIYDRNGIEKEFSIEEVSTDNNLLNAIRNPMTVYISDSKPNDWYTNAPSKQNDQLWNSSDGKKTIYDPCPAGWCVAGNPGGFSDGPLHGMSAKDTDIKDRGYSTPLGYMPSCFIRYYYNGNLGGIASFHWNKSTRNDYAYVSFCPQILNGSWIIELYRPVPRAYGIAVRCVKEY